jgi:hypothetical protein
MRLFFIGIFLLLNCLLSAAPTGAKAYKIEAGFTLNEGQFVDQFGQTNKQVLFLFQSPEMLVHLRESGFSYELREKINQASIVGSFAPKGDSKSIKIKSHRIDIDFAGCNRVIEKQTFDQISSSIYLNSRSNLEAVKNLKSFKRILYKNVYPQTDIEFLVSDIDGKARFKYNIILHPGADESKVQLLIEGSLKNTLTKDGFIEMQTSLGVIEEQVPLSYELTKQGKQGCSIGARFRQIKEKIFGIAVDERDRRYTCVIDPLIWGSYFGGTLSESLNDMCLDSLGNVYIGGYTNSTDFIASSGAHQTIINGGQDAFIAKFSATGTLLWSTYFGGDANDFITDLKVDKDQNLYIAGTTYSQNGVATAGAYKTTLSGIADGFLSKFSPLGSVIWSTYVGGISSESFEGLCVDVFGDIVVSGFSNSTDLVFNFPNIHQDSIKGTSDIVILKFNKTGSLIWGTFYGGTANDNMNGICSDAFGNIYIGGNTNSASDIATAGMHQTVKSTGVDGLIAKFNKDGALVFGTYLGGAGTEIIFDLEIDAAGYLIGSGYTTSASGIATIGSHDTSYYSVGGYDGFMFQFNTNGTMRWSTYYGGDGNDYIYSVVGDAFGNIYGLGITNSTIEIATPGAMRTNLLGNYDGFLVSFTTAGTRLNGTYLGGSSNDVFRSVALDKQGSMFLSGHTFSDSGIATPNGFDTSYAGLWDGFVLKIEGLVPSVLGNNTIIFDQGLCLGEAAALLTGTAPAGGSGTYTYLWTSSTTGAAGAYIPAAGVNNTNSYSPGVLSTNTWYKRTVFSGTEVHTSNVVSIAVSDKLNAGFTLNKMIQCDRGNNFVFTDTTQAGNPNITRVWDFGNGKFSGNVTDSMSYTFGTENTFVVKLINSINGACADTASIRIYIIPNPPLANIVGNANVLRGKTETYSVTPRIGSTYTWMYDKGVGISNTDSIKIKWTDLGTTELKLLEQTGGGCYGDTAYLNITIDKPLGGSEMAWDNDLLLYPNPSNGMVFIQDGLNRNLAISVQSILGEQVYEGKAQLDGSIDLSHLGSGIYLIKLSTAEGEIFVRKIEISN